ncbi:MAG: type II toxin-antitoxin system VapC family toxin [Brevundimonas sp.]|nr:type II toxin-antitoxin system VapC family toxin [Brevundimonas sp.]
MIERPILLDTCAALWLVDGLLKPDAQATLRETLSAGISVAVSPITAWEVGILVAKSRVSLASPPLTWFNSLISLGIDLADLTPEVLVAATELKAPELRDPADRIIAATARAFNYRLMTRDRPLLDFAERGQAIAIAC